MRPATKKLLETLIASLKGIVKALEIWLKEITADDSANH